MVSNGLTGFVKFFTKTPMRKYGGMFGAGGFATGYVIGKSNMSMTDTLMTIGVIGTVLGSLDGSVEKEDNSKKN